MIDIKKEVKEALDTIGATAFFYYPNMFTKLPCVSYYESFNGVFTSGDDTEYVSEIVYVVDVWGETNETVTNIAIEADAVMAKLGFRREFSHDVYDPGSKIRHKTMRFKIIL